jgi:hypothetical protein
MPVVAKGTATALAIPNIEPDGEFYPPAESVNHKVKANAAPSSHSEMGGACYAAC